MERMRPPAPPVRYRGFSCSLMKLVALVVAAAAVVGGALPAAAMPPSATGDLAALLEFKAKADVAGKLSSWNASDPFPCSGRWYGVSCSPAGGAGATAGRVVRLVLEHLSLSGSAFPALTALDQLRVLSLKGNGLSGPIPDLSPFAALKLLFLSHNRFSGVLPATFPARLYRLDLSGNNISGHLPAAGLSRLTHLLTLRLDGNRLSGPISGLVLPNLQDLNVSGNLLVGAVPPSLAGFPSSAFSGNPGLCGGPLSRCAAAILAAPPKSPAATAVVSSSPGFQPGGGIASSTAAGNATAGERRPAAAGGRMSRLAVVVLVVGDFIVLVLIAGLLFCYFWRKFSGGQLQEGEKIVFSSSPYTAASHAGAGGGAAAPFERGKMVFFEGMRRFELEDLLRASAEMLGKGGYGTTYKAVLDDGAGVAVKRLREAPAGGAAASYAGAAGVGRREFEQHMDVLGRLRHPHVVSLRAYYYARDEKLLVYDFMPDGSVFSLLHGNRGPGRTPLDWAARVRIAGGAARGLAYIHQQCRSSPKLAHGNIKSSNVLIDKSGAARVSEFGLAALAPAAGAARSNGYRAPELAAAGDSRKAAASHKADVYSFGVLLLELLTGKFPAAEGYGGAAAVADLPRWVHSVVREEWTAEVFDLELMRYKDIEEELVAMLQIAMACTAPAPEQRPKMAAVVKMIEDIRGGGAEPAGSSPPPSQESFGSISDSPSASDATSL